MAAVSCCGCCCDFALCSAHGAYCSVLAGAAQFLFLHFFNDCLAGLLTHTANLDSCHTQPQPSRLHHDALRLSYVGSADITEPHAACLSTASLWQCQQYHVCCPLLCLSVSSCVGRIFLTTDGTIVLRVGSRGLLTNEFDCITEDYLTLEEDGEVLVDKMCALHVSGPGAGQTATAAAPALCQQWQPKH